MSEQGGKQLASAWRIVRACEFSLHDVEHVKLAAHYFSDWAFSNERERRVARERIREAAERFGLSVEEMPL
jgi:hypothetical protein